MLTRRKKSSTKFSVYEVVLEGDEQSGYFVSCPCLPECHATGMNEEGALANMKNAIIDYLRHRIPLKGGRRFLIIEEPG